jgi:hypothetical protein
MHSNAKENAALTGRKTLPGSVTLCGERVKNFVAAAERLLREGKGARCKAVAFYVRKEHFLLIGSAFPSHSMFRLPYPHKLHTVKTRLLFSKKLHSSLR